MLFLCAGLFIRYSIFDRHYDLDALVQNVQDIVASLAAFVYQKPREVADEFMAESLAVDKEHLKVSENMNLLPYID